MGFLSGNSGSIQFGNADTVDTSVDPEVGWRTTDTKITNWTLNTSAALLDTTTLGDYDKTSVYGLRTTSGTLRLFYYTTPGTDGIIQGNPNNNSASYFIRRLQKDQGDSDPEAIKVRLRLYLDDQNMLGRLGNRDYVDLDANLTSVSYGSNVGELVSVDVSFEATGPIRQNRV